MGCRKSVAGLTPAERQAFVNAVLALKAGGKYDVFNTIHASTMMPGGVMVHGYPLFFPWHRQMILDYEHELQAIDSSVSLPYWDWSVANLNPSGTESLIWRADFMGGPGNAAGAITGPFAGWGFTRRQFDPFQFPGTGGQLATAMNQPKYGPFNNEVEGPHGAAHEWVGGDMADVMTSPHDPVFFLLHCNVDRLWAEWIHRHQNDVGFVPYEPQNGGEPGQNFNDQMWPWDGSARPTAMAPWSSAPQIITPANVVDHRALGYFYDTIDPECRPVIKLRIKDSVKEVIKDVKDRQKDVKEVAKEHKDAAKEHKDAAKEHKELVKEQLKDQIKEFKEKDLKEFKEKDKDLVEGGHFIPPELRPDLARSPLASESDVTGTGGEPTTGG
jgi:tyrosinase